MKIIIKNLQKKIPVYPKRIKKAALKTLSSERVKKTGEITICFVSGRQIRELNLFYLGRYEPTDVISFEIVNSANSLVADIAVSADAATGNARAFKTSPGYELSLYAVHGILHLLGYNDSGRRKREAMQKKAEKILSEKCLSIKAKR